MHHISIDIETSSSIPIGDAGAYRYAESKDFEILLFAYAIDDEPVKVLDLMVEEIPERIQTILQNPNYVKHAYNAAFEWYCLNRAGYKTSLQQWQCTMIHGMYCGYPAGLSLIGEAIGLPEDKQKMSIGKALIRYFCVPVRSTRSNGGRMWHIPEDDPEKWELFKEYNAQDVEAERAIWKKLKGFPVPESIWDEWRADVEMNAFGVRIDRKMVTGAISIYEQSTYELTEKVRAITGLDNPNSPLQLRGWLENNGIDTEDLTKGTVASLMESDLPSNVRTVLRTRQMLGKASNAKYSAMIAAAGDDDRIRGLTQFYGASRTGRWAGRLVQMQNLPRNYLGTIDTAKRIVSRGDYQALKMLYGNVPDTLSQLIRTAFIPSEGHKFVVADFSAIEARVIAWLAGETWAQEEFAGEGKIYEATAAQMFGVDKSLIRKGNPEYALRQKGKVATLALGYQGGTAALEAMGALDMGIPAEELQSIVDLWRRANPNIVALWYAVGDAALKTVKMGTPHSVNIKDRDPLRARDNEGYMNARSGAYSDWFIKRQVPVKMSMSSNIADAMSFLTITLPSGRKLYYVSPKVDTGRYGQETVSYMGLNQTTRKWERHQTYGGKLTENIVQAVARDCLAVTLERIRAKGWKVVFHVHDEVIIDAPLDVTADEVCDLMGRPIEWAPGLILKAAGFESNYYMKD